MPDFSDAGSDGTLPVEFHQWQRGATCTVRPTLLTPLLTCQEYRLNVTVRQTRMDTAEAGFAELYERATLITSARLGELTCDNPASRRHGWIAAQAWFEERVGTKRLCSATITTIVAVTQDNGHRPLGEPRPDPAAFLSGSGGDPDAFAAKHLGSDGERNLDELYVDFGALETSEDITLSYGEYVRVSELVDFAPVVRRAEAWTRFYARTTHAAWQGPLTILRREWAIIETGKKANPHIAVVHVFART